MLTCSQLPLLLLHLLLLYPVEARTEVTASEIREAADSSRKLAAELTVILKRVRAGENQEDIVRKLRSKIKTLEEELDTESREEQEERKKEDSARRNRLTKFRKMLREFYRGAHYDFSL